MENAYQPKTKTLGNDTYASNPGHVRLSHARLRRFHPEYYGFAGVLLTLRALLRGMPRAVAHLRTHAEEHLLYGDGRAAVVVSRRPLLVAAYSDELDCVAMLRFDDALAEEYGLDVGSWLLTVNTYGVLDTQPDLEPGPGNRGNWRNFAPFIADFLTDDTAVLEAQKAFIPSEEWARARELGEAYLQTHGLFARDGRPFHVSEPATPL